MKIYFIDIKEKYLKLKDKLISAGIENIEVKDSYSFRCTKNDFVILPEYIENNAENDLLKKYSNLIIITNKNDEDTIWKLANEYKTKDIISSKCNDEYISKRIAKAIL